MDIVVGVITEVVNYLVSPLMNHVSYLVHYKRNAIDLRKQMESLNALKVDKKHSMDAAGMRGEVIKEEVKDWLTKVDQMQTKEMELNNTLEDSKGCHQGCCYARYKVGKDAKDLIDVVKGLLNEGRTFASVSDPSPLPPGLESMPTQDFHVYDSTKVAIDQIMNALNKDEDINMVGVYGIGGVGKTTLMKEVAKKLKHNGFFYQVVMVTVSQDPVLTKIQGEIAENLGLPLKEESLNVRARLLLERLKKEKQILIVLDDLWKELNLLEEIGIPCGNNCKVVLTTRQLEVCTQMKTQVNIEVKVLSERDSWVLFKWAAGDCIEDDDMLRPVAEQIVKECGGLPLAIITIGRALRAKGRSEWEDAASQLKKSCSSPPDIAGVHEKVFCSIKLSYDYLASDATKFCLLLCCMFPEDYSISVDDDLLPYVVGEGVFGNTSSLREARNRLVTQMERLKRSCLLLDDSGRKEGNVRMHDIIRDVSIWIASEEGHDFVVESGRPLTNWPDGETLKKCKRLSLMRSKITKLPDRGLDCYQLETLSLRDNYDYLREIPDGFFQGMTSLKILDLENIGISSIPSSLACLTDLRVLRITHNYDNCIRNYVHCDRLSLDVSLLEKLKKLEILHLQNLVTVKLPKEMGELTNLKSLKLSTNEILSIAPNTLSLSIAPNTLSKLSLMEELDLPRIHFREEEEEVAWLSEVAHLSTLRLTTLNIKISNIKCLCATKIPVSWEKLTRFSVAFGPKWIQSYSDFDQCKTRVHLYGRIPPLSDPERMFYLLEVAEGLYLYDFCGLKYVMSSLHARGSNNLRLLYIKGSNDIEDILSSSSVNEAEDRQEVGNDEENTQAISSTSTVLQLNSSSSSSSSSLLRPTPIFCNLRSLSITQCDRLKYVLPMSLALQCLQQLEYLLILNCSKLEEIIVNDIDDDDDYIEQKEATYKTVLFPRLKFLRLAELPNLSMVSKGVQLSHHHDYHWPSLETLSVFGCPNLKRLTMSLQTVTKLRQIEVEDEKDEWFNRLEWDVDDDDDQTHENKLLLHHLQERGVLICSFEFRSAS